MSTGDARANDQLDALYGDNRAANMPPTVWLEVYYGAPSDAGGGTPASYPEAARVAIASDSVNFPDAVDRRKELAIDVALPTPSVDTDPIVAWALHGHATNDDILNWDYFQDDVRAAADQPIVIRARTLAIELAS